MKSVTKAILGFGIVMILSSAGPCESTNPEGERSESENENNPLLAINKLGGGIVESTNLSGISCGTAANDCSARYPSGTIIILRATSSSEHVFIGWNGDACGPNLDGTPNPNVNGPVCTVVVNQSMTVGALFYSTTGVGPGDLIPFSIEVQGRGTISGATSSNPNAFFCGVSGNICSASLPVLTPVNLQAIPDGDNYFIGWNGDSGCINNLLSDTGVFTVSAAPSNQCIAEFSNLQANGDYIRPFILRVQSVQDSAFTSGGQGRGTVQVSRGLRYNSNGLVNDFACTNSDAEPFKQCQKNYYANVPGYGGTTLKLRAEPADGSSFVGWICNTQDSVDTGSNIYFSSGTSTSAEVEVFMSNQSRTCTAHFTAGRVLTVFYNFSSVSNGVDYTASGPSGPSIPTALDCTTFNAHSGNTTCRGIFESGVNVHLYSREADYSTIIWRNPSDPVNDGTANAPCSSASGHALAYAQPTCTVLMNENKTIRIDPDIN